MTKPTIDLADTIESWRSKTNIISDNVGDPAILTTTADSNMVSAINELKSRIDSDETSLVGALSSLTTTDKSSVVDAINEIDRRLPDIYDNTGTLLNT